MEQLSSDFFENNDHALRQPTIVLRDSLGTLAIELLSSREDISNMEYDVLLSKLHAIICELHDTYDRMNLNFTD